MKTKFQITLWDKITDAIADLEYDELQPIETEVQMVDRLIELAYHYRFELNKLKNKIYESSVRV